jgi:hypothetical protein
VRISLLAWGSIVWDRQNLEIVADFEPTGPRLPIEFCRISRDGRLTLVIDESYPSTIADAGQNQMNERRAKSQRGNAP